MLKKSIPIVLTVLAIAATSAAQTKCCGNKPAIRSIDRTCLPAGAPRANLPLYTSDLNEKYQEIANIDSFISTNKCADTTRRQLKDLQAKGQAIGADALIRVRPLANEVTGWKEASETPFWSVKQGESKDYFYRATAIKYLQWPKKEPQPLAIQQSAAPASIQTSPLIDTNALLKINTDRTNRYEMDMPKVFVPPSPSGN